MVRRYDPFRQMEAIFDDAMRQGPSRAAMPLDLYRDGEKFIALFDLPGVDPASVDIDIEDRTLTIRAERKSPEITGAQWLTHECPFGTFARQLTLGNGVALDQVEAEYVDGVLKLVIPVAEEAKPRKIAVQRGSRQIEGNAETLNDAD